MMIQRRTFRPLGTTSLRIRRNLSGELLLDRKSPLPDAHVTPTLLTTPYLTTQVAPSLWDSYSAVGNVAAPIVPYYGGSTLLAGNNINSNEVVFFGGSTCRTTSSPPILASRLASRTRHLSSTRNRSGRQRWHQDGSGSGCNGGDSSCTCGHGHARGTDGSAVQGNILIVAFGGMVASGVGNDTNIYYMWFNAGTPTWQTPPLPEDKSVRPDLPSSPTGLLVYSHVTKKYYLFGGYNPINGTLHPARPGSSA